MSTSSGSRESLVGLMADKGPEVVVGILSILRSGCALVPISPDYPEERIGFIVEECGIEVLLTQSHYLEKVVRLATVTTELRHVVCLDGEPEAPIVGAPFTVHGPEAWQHRDGEANSAAAEQLAYVIYTSGSTGQPKGVPITHDNLVPLLLWSRDYFGFGEQTRVASSLSYWFDFGLFEILSTLLFGGQLYLPQADESDDPARFASWIAERRLNTLHGTPSFMREITGAATQPLTDLQVLHLGGEALVRPEIDRLFEAVGEQCVLYNGYGPTETSVNSAIFTIGSRAERHDDGSANTPIGNASADNRLYVLDRQGNPVPIGVAGELHIGGAGLSRGYWQRQQLTAERFRPDPFGDVRGARLYRTGDIVHFRPDLAIEFLGRVDYQVKLRGFRIEPGEIEAALLEHPAVNECVVVLWGESPEEQRLVAYVAAATEQSPGPEELRAFLRELLPHFMIPGTFLAVPQLPRTATGKLDRQALPAPPQVEADNALVLPPATPTEEVVAGTWQEVLERTEIGRDANFFDLGGHSLLGTQVISRLRRAFDVDLAIASLFHSPTVRGLAEEIDAALEATGGASLPPIRPVPRDRVLPLSFAQQRLWFLNQAALDNPAYNVPRVTRLEGELDIPALAATFDEILRRHEILRTSYPVVSGQVRQVIADDATLGLSVIDLAALPAEEREELRLRLVRQESRRPFDLAHGPVIRGHVVRLDPRDHVLLLTLHHIAWDGWSLGIFDREVHVLYEAFRHRQPSPLPELPVQYADYAVWQRQVLEGEMREQQLGYWRQVLAGAPPLLALPTDRPRPSVLNQQGAMEHIGWPYELLKELRQLSRSQDVTLFMTLLAGWQEILSRYSGQLDICIGSGTANRNRVETEGMIGFFVNTFALRTDLSGRLTFQELLGRARETALGAYAHQEVPFEQVVEAVQPQRSASYSPIFQVTFGLQNIAAEATNLSGLEQRSDLIGTGGAVFDLTLFMLETPETLDSLVEYSVDLFDRVTIERLMKHLRRLLEQAVADPRREVATLSLLSAEERQQLMTGWNLTARPYPRQAGLAELFAGQVARRPEAVALQFSDGQLSYVELDRRARLLATELGASGVGNGSLVGLCLERSTALAVGILGILQAGGAYVPLDPDYPDERLAFMAEDAGLAAVVTGQTHATDLPDLGVPTLLLERVLTVEANVSASADGGGDLAYVIYTSGSTGRPKGVGVPQRAVARLVLGADYVDLCPGDRIAQVSTASFDAATFEIWGALLTGGRLVGLERKITLEPAELAAALARHRIDTLFLTTALFNQVVHLEPAAFAGLRELLFGGEAVDPNAVRSALAAGPPRRLLHVYGPTESTTFATWYEVDHVAAKAATVPIGQPLANTTAYVFDRHGELSAIDVPGELFLGADGLALGYLHRPALTAERFVPHPFIEDERLYRTGDRVRRRADGTIEFLGRGDHQIKLRGFRIELGEIEAVLRKHPAIGDAAVVLAESLPFDKQLVAYAVPTAQATLPTAELRDFLGERLPDYMVPHLFVGLPELPLNANGKLDRSALPEPESGSSLEPDSDDASPKTPVERLVAEIWSELLGIGPVNIHDDFFELGGHSLSATRMMAQLNQALGISLPIWDLFEGPTLGELAERAAAAQLSEAGARPAILPAPEETERCLSFAQERLWFLDHLEPESPVYNVPLALRLQGPLNARALKTSLDEILRRHEVLRTSMPAVNGKASIRIHTDRRLDLADIDLRSVAESAKAVALRHIAGEESTRPFRLAIGPLVRGRLVRLAAEDYVLLLTIHHIVCDGWSMPVLIRELFALYGAFSIDRPSPLEPLPVQYSDYARWQRDWLEGETLEEQIGYWRQTLSGAPSLLRLPTDRPRPSVQTYRGNLASTVYSRSLLERAAALGRSHEATLFMTLLAAFQTLLGRYSGQRDICIGTPVANRSQAEIEGLIGFFVNTLVMRTSLSDESSFSQLLAQVRETALSAFNHQELPFERVVDTLAPERSLSYSPLFQVLFTLQDEPLRELEVGKLKIAPADFGDDQVAKFDLSMGLIENKQGLVAAIEYNVDLFDRTTVLRLLEHLGTLLEQAVASPDESIERLELLTVRQRFQLLEEWNATPVIVPPLVTLASLFAAQAKRDPDRVALIVGDESLTFGELRSRAKRWARRLVDDGIGPEVGVGVFLDRSSDLVVALLAVLEAGGFYIPLDPNYPPSRVELLLRDSGAKVVLTSLGLCHQLPPNSARLICVDAEAPEPTSNAAGGRRAAESNNLAYVIYTSGSTGVPKGVGIEHRATVALLSWAAQVYGEEERRGVLASTSVCFDLSIFELFLPLTMGGTVVLAENLFDLPRLPAADRVSLVNTVPSVLAELLRFGGMPPSVTTINLAGEALQSDLVDRLGEAARAPAIYNLYGPSECTTYSTTATISPGVADPVPIGQPISNTRAYILDRHLQPTAPGVLGELFLAGAGVARGYLGRPVQTAESFLPSPFGDGDRLYRTGDLARFGGDGSLEFHGRIDRQVKLHGFRIELEETEVVLARHPQVGESAVVLQDDSAGHPHLAAYLVASDGQAPTSATLASYLREHLPNYMVPGTFRLLEELPRTPNGKVDRRALATIRLEAELEGPERGDYVAPRNAVEEQLTAIWSEVLQRETVGVDDNFFEIGGDSILSIQVASRAQQAGLRLTTKQLFQAQTIAELAKLVGTAATEAEQGMVVGEVPLTPAQRWFFAQRPAHPHHFNQAIVLTPREQLTMTALDRALSSLVGHHDALRLRFRRQGEHWEAFQCDDLASSFRLRRVDLSRLSDADRRTALERSFAVAHASLRLEQGPLFEATLLDLEPETPGRLHLVVHHLAMDWVSWGILLTDLTRAYESATRDEKIDLGLKTTSFRQWASSLVEDGVPSIAEEREHWHSTVLPSVPSLPRDFPAGDNSSATTELASSVLSRGETASLLQAAGVAYRVQPRDLVVAALAAGIASATGQRRLRLVLEGHGREELRDSHDLSRTVGWFTSIYPLMIDLEGKQSSEEVIVAVKESLRRVPRQGIGWGISRYLSTESDDRALAEAPEPEISFNYLGHYATTSSQASLLEVAPESSGPVRHPDSQRPHLLEVSAVIADDRLQLNIAYSRGLHRQQTVEAWLTAITEALRALIDHCLAPGAGRLTADDFTEFGWQQPDLDQILGEIDRTSEGMTVERGDSSR